MTNTITFVRSGAPVTITPTPYAGTNFPLPATDSVNLDLMVTNTGAGPAWLSFAPGAPVGAAVAGNLVVPGGTSLLCTTNPATIAAGNSNGAVVSPQNGAWQTATTVSAVVAQSGTAIVLQRGYAVARGTV